MTSKILLLLTIVLSVVFVLLSFIYFSNNSSNNVDYNSVERLFVQSGKPLDYGVSWDNVNGLILSGILVSERTITDEKGKYIEILVPEFSNLGKKVKVKSYFREDNLLSFLSLKEGKFVTREVWVAYYVDDILSKLRGNAQVKLSFSDVKEDEYLKFLDSVKFNNTTSLLKISNITIIR